MAEERRLVTILFADVVGSTALGEELDPEDVRALLRRLYGIATDAVERHGGHVEKFIGDAIMAVFGTPIAHDDDPARALSAAIELRDRVRADAILAERVPIRLGVNGGEVIASRDIDGRVLVTGDPVNVAARLQSASEPWAILVGERTVRATGDRFQFGPQVQVEAKGKSVPVLARVLKGIATTRVARRQAKIVGREADLDQLELVARRTFAERRPYLVSIVAPAGVGKSRLLEEFLDRLAPEVQVATAQCLPYGQRLTYWPMRAILISIVGCRDDSASAWTDRAVASALKIGVPDLISAAYDAAGAIALGRDQMHDVLKFALKRHDIEDRLSTSERADAWIVHTWSEFLIGNLEASADAAERARAGLMSGQASSFVLGATSWRVMALHALGRWDEALVEAARAERAWQESEFEAPWYAVNCLMAAQAICRSRDDPVGAAHWRDLVLRIDERSSADVRTRQLVPFVNDDPAELVRQALADFRIWTGRYDYVHLCLGFLTDRRHPIGGELLDAIVEYTEARGLDLVSAQARRARGVERRNTEDLERALALFERMDAKPFVARVHTELGLMASDASVIELGLDELERLGDVEQAARVAAERRAGAKDR